MGCEDRGIGRVLCQPYVRVLPCLVDEIGTRLGGATVRIHSRYQVQGGREIIECVDELVMEDLDMLRGKWIDEDEDEAR